MKDFDFLAAVVKRGWERSGNGGGSLSKGSRIGIYQGVFDGATCFGNSGCLWAVTGDYCELSEHKVGFSGATDVSTSHPVSRLGVHFRSRLSKWKTIFFRWIRGLIQDCVGITKNFFKSLLGLKVQTVYSAVFEREISNLTFFERTAFFYDTEEIVPKK